MHKEFPERTVGLSSFGFPKGSVFYQRDERGGKVGRFWDSRWRETITIKICGRGKCEGEYERRDRKEEEEKEGDGDGDEKTVAGDLKMDCGCTDLAEAIAASRQTTEGHTTTTRNSDNSISGEEEAIARAVEASMLDERRTRRPTWGYQIMTRWWKI